VLPLAVDNFNLER